MKTKLAPNRIASVPDASAPHTIRLTGAIARDLIEELGQGETVRHQTVVYRVEGKAVTIITMNAQEGQGGAAERPENADADSAGSPAEPDREAKGRSPARFEFLPSASERRAARAAEPGNAARLLAGSLREASGLLRGLVLLFEDLDAADVPERLYPAFSGLDGLDRLLSDMVREADKLTDY